jgi:iron complex outermembrane recepter protein
MSGYYHCQTAKRKMMKTLIYKIILVSVLLLASSFLSSQTIITVKGVVRDHSNNEPIPSVNISVSGMSNPLMTDANGTFKVELAKSNLELDFNHIAYQAKKVTISSTSGEFINLGNIFLEPLAIGLKEVHIISSYISDNNTPVAVSTISARTIERQTGNQDYPEIMKLTPGIYATKSGGGSGDDRLTIRGFQQENIALLLNGVPVSSMENGLVYWSNWIGLSDATEAIQVQRGLGASMAAMNSVGGTVNIITKSTQAEKGGSIRYSLSGYGNQKSILQLSTGKMKHGIAVTFLGSRSVGPGYVDGTYVNGWAYFLSVSKEFNPKHKLVFTALGSPEHHGQRNYGLTYEQVDKFGTRYNPSWGIYKGTVFNLSENFYHKPQINLNHYWNMSPSTFLASSAYVSFGYGGGRYSESLNSPKPLIWSFTKGGQIDFDAAYSDNLDNADSIQLENGSWVNGYSKNILTQYRANHYWVGLLTNLTHSINEKLKLTAGLHVRAFRSRLYEEVDDLMGGNYWLEKYAWSKSGVAGRNQVKKIGDVINVDNYSIMKYGNLFGQLEYQPGNMKYFIASSVSATAYQRKDPYNYVSDPFSNKVRKAGFDMKTGLSYELGNHIELYANLGYYSREPYFKFVYVDFSNTIAQNLRNEKIAASELGLKFHNGQVTSRLNAYYTLWKDKALLTRENIQLSDSIPRSLVKGLNALHRGIEMESSILLLKNLSVTGSFSLGDWKWQNDVTASIYNDNQVLVDSVRIYTKGLFVGDAPQTQLGLSIDFTLLEHFNLVANWVYYDRLYANFDPSNRTNKADRTQPYRIPAYSIFDFYLNYDFEIRNFPASLQLSCQNIFDKEAITRGDDGINHNASSFTGFWAQGRTFNVSMKINF